ncbi:MAG: T9SS type A sorting domain-containing protein [Bacteroidetes bacterium]|nr:T9SS type A sorting domain-containing protein [Bacteroidota bacterium]
MQHTFYALVLFIGSFVLAPSIAEAQCSAAVSDTLLPGFNLQLTATPLSGVPPFTYTWTIQGSIGGNIAPVYSSSANDTILIGASDLFANYGCVIISLCMQDSTGCTTCLSDTAYTNAIVCYSAFDTIQTQPGQLLIMLPNYVPQHVGFSIITWNDLGGQQSAPLIDGMGFLNYNPPVYNAAGYDVPVCVQTMFFNSGFFCIACDTLHIAAAAPNGLPGRESTQYSIAPNPVSQVLQVRPAQPLADAVLQLTDLSGQLLYTAPLSGEAAIDVQAYPAGVYLLHLKANGYTTTHKVLHY